MWGACMARAGHVALRKGPGWVCSRPVAGGEVPSIGKERGAGTVGQGGQEGGSEIGDVPAGVLGLHMRYVYTGKRSERSPYIAES